MGGVGFVTPSSPLPSPPLPSPPPFIRLCYTKILRTVGSLVTSALIFTSFAKFSCINKKAVVLKNCRYFLIKSLHPLPSLEVPGSAIGSQSDDFSFSRVQADLGSPLGGQILCHKSSLLLSNRPDAITPKIPKAILSPSCHT